MENTHPSKTLKFLDSNILDLSSKDAQIIAIPYGIDSGGSDQRSEYYAMQEFIDSGLYVKYEYAKFLELPKANSGSIKVVGNIKGQRKIVAMFCIENNSIEKKLFEQCLSKIAKIKNLKSIAFPECQIDKWNYINVIEKFAKEISVDVYIAKNRKECIQQTIEKCLEDCTKNCAEKCVANCAEVCVEKSVKHKEKIAELSYRNGITSIVNFQKEQLYANGWGEFFDDMINSNILSKIDKTIISDVNSNITIFPSANLVFNALLLTPLENVKVIIIGQDPYQVKGAAMGLSFSTPGKMQPSLTNIYKEVKDCGFNVDDNSGDLTKWAKEGVLLLNTAFTVKEGISNSYGNLWNKEFSPQLLKYISRKCEHVVVMLWGGYAQKLEDNFTKTKHHILKCAHPSPLNTNGGFLGNKHFTKANTQLERWGIEKVDWNLV